MFRTATNCPTPQRPAENNNNNADGGGGDTGNQMDVPENDADATEAGRTEATYDARSARKPSRRQQKNEEFQEKLLQAISVPPPVEAPAPEPEKDYVDLAFAALIKKMKTSLNANEIMDAVEEVEQVVNRICRQKRRRLEYQPGTSNTRNLFESLTTIGQNQAMGVGPAGPSAVPVNFQDDQYQQHLQF